MQQCRDCTSLLDEPQAILCPGCRAAATEKRKARKRDNAKARYHSNRRATAPDEPRLTHPRPPHSCLTKGCPTPVQGKALFCPACRRVRHLIHQKRHRDHVKALNDDLPPEPITNLNWLNNFSDWAKSGLSYAEYQKARPLLPIDNLKHIL